MLNEIDEQFDVAETYFNKKQVRVENNLKMSNPKRYQAVQSRINTNIQSAIEEQ